MNNDENIKNLIKKDYLSINQKPQNRKLDAKILRKIRLNNSKKMIVITLVSLIGAAMAKQLTAGKGK